MFLGYRMPHEVARFYYYSINAKDLQNKYSASVYPGSIIIINSDNGNSEHKNWSALADGEVLVHEVSGVEHLKMLSESNIGKWVKLIKGYIGEMQVNKSDTGV